GKGRDVFVFDVKPNRSHADKIVDFESGFDTIALLGSAFKKIGKAGDLKGTAFRFGKEARDRDDRILYDKKSGAMYYDADGSGKGKAIVFASVAKKSALTFHDFDIL